MTDESIGTYAMTTLSSRLLRSTTIKSYQDTLTQLALWDVPLSNLSLQLIFNRLMEVPNLNTRRKHTVACKSMFKDYEWSKQLKIPRAVPRVYDLPDEDTLRFALMLSPFELQGLLMMYGGLRCGEAAAIKAGDVKGNVLTVSKQRNKDGRLVEAKTSGQVVIPMWLAERVMVMEDRIMTPGQIRESFRRYGLKAGIHLNPHMLRHWYATMLVNRRINPEIARRQMRHADLKTTLGYYAQVKKADIDSVVSDLFEGK